MSRNAFGVALVAEMSHPYWAAIVACLLLAGCTAARHPASPSPAAAPSFTCARLADSPTAPFGIGIGDWNGDGTPDLAVSSSDTGRVSVYLNDGHGKFTSHGEVFSGQIARHVAVGDMNGDGHLDLAVANGESHDVAILLGDGSGGFRNVKQYRTGISPFDVALADLDGDGRLDLVIVNESNALIAGPHGIVSVLFGQPEGFAPPLKLNAGDHPSAVAVAELNGTAGLDLAVTNWKSDTVSIFTNTGTRSFEHSGEIAYGGGRPYGVAAGDYNRDGFTDLAVTDLEHDAVVVMYGDGHGTFPRTASYKVGPGVRHVVSVDLDGDGVLDLVTANTLSDSVSLLIGRPDGSFAPAQTMAVGLKPRTVMTRDLNGDGKPDIVVTDSGSDAVSLLFQTSGPSQACPQ